MQLKLSGSGNGVRPGDPGGLRRTPEAETRAEKASPWGKHLLSAFAGTRLLPTVHLHSPLSKEGQLSCTRMLPAAPASLLAHCLTCPHLTRWPLTCILGTWSRLGIQRNSFAPRPMRTPNVAFRSLHLSRGPCLLPNLCAHFGVLLTADSTTVPADMLQTTPRAMPCTEVLAAQLGHFSQ